MINSVRKKITHLGVLISTGVKGLGLENTAWTQIALCFHFMEDQCQTCIRNHEITVVLEH